MALIIKNKPPRPLKGARFLVPFRLIALLVENRNLGGDQNVAFVIIYSRCARTGRARIFHWYFRLGVFMNDYFGLRVGTSFRV